ncbi:hypothetical protein [Roseicella aquatilis]|uniref:Uncharacterized protein n=1 Tax=Roseicella aquatilis TaxID=2527868 RepID=A0A4V2WM03_9PROT|nr:hypothetical protein [Roseicella aquatilis]TCZ65557.1 hypothetical protein EXY23_05150 [Roseicella aquatilis]
MSEAPDPAEEVEALRAEVAALRAEIAKRRELEEAQQGTIDALRAIIATGQGAGRQQRASGPPIIYPYPGNA